MDQFGEEILAGLPPDLIPPGLDGMFGEDALATDIDVPFTASAQRVIERCAWYAEQAGVSSVLSEHLLSAIEDSPESAVARLMQEHNWTATELLSVLQFCLGKEIVPPTPPNVATPRLERLIIRAKREAFRYQHAEASTMHLLWALIRERAGSSVYSLERQASAYQRTAPVNHIAIRAGEAD